MVYRYLRSIWPSQVVHCLWLFIGASTLQAQDVNQVAGKLITLNTNGAWSWYMDERVIVDTVGQKILASSVADASGTDGTARNGDIDVVAFDLASGTMQHFVLHEKLQADDHNAAALLVRPDGRYLATSSHDNTILVWDVSALLKK